MENGRHLCQADSDSNFTRDKSCRGATTDSPGAHAPNYPAATEEQYDCQRKEFIDSLDESAVCALVSRHNNGKPCQVLDKKHGSFNVCFAVTFGHEDPQWAIRVPIETAFDDPWDKLQSEVATMQ
ncbi:hypothetical protein CPLU01_04418 [Colletotrichum plurivorum]|uniref:Uncharacterized protein n=1 Tax=Colletotrichum plurivorum TaxID=2175906 RepID=A0A8H6NJQ0_9PEZI|nr:hypothetical protein CPLU01_04418 [Colletotrichum plurivorum]